MAGVRVRPAGVLTARAADRAAADGDGAVPVHRRRRVRLLHDPAERDQLPAELQRRQLRHPAAGAGLLQVLDHGPDGHGAVVPGADRDPRDHARRDRHAPAAAQEPPLRHPRHRGGGDAAARSGPHHDAHADGPALGLVRGLYPLSSTRRPSRGTCTRTRGGRAGRLRRGRRRHPARPRSRRLNKRCCST